MGLAGALALTGRFWGRCAQGANIEVQATGWPEVPWRNTCTRFVVTGLDNELVALLRERIEEDAEHLAGELEKNFWSAEPVASPGYGIGFWTEREVGC